MHTLDEARAELPLTADKQDTFPIGVVLETGTTHQLTIGENQIPVMPMVHILSTHGFFLSFDLLNFQPNAVGICSPPQPINDRSGIHLFTELSPEPKTPVNELSQQQPLTRSQQPSKPASIFQTPSSNGTPLGNMTFAIPENSTSTPAKPPAGSFQTKTLFPAPGSRPAPAPLFGNGGSGLSSFGQTVNVANEPPKNVTVAQPIQRTEAAKPFLTVDSNYTPPIPNAVSDSTTRTSQATSNASTAGENDSIIRKMIADEIQSFESIIRGSLEKSKKIDVNVCSKEECSQLLKKIDELKDVSSQAIKSTEDLSGEIQALRLTLYESFAMSAEAQSKFDLLNNPNKSSSQEENVTISQAHRRQLNKLDNLLTQNLARFDIVSKQIDAHWSAHLDRTRETKRATMHIPSLENVYQTMERQQQILMTEKLKINNIKSRIGMYERGDTPSKIKYSFDKPEKLKTSIIDSVLSMTISDQICSERKPLNTRKIDELRHILEKRPVQTIKPLRPDVSSYMRSQVVIEKKLASAKAEKQKQKEKIAVAPVIQQPVLAKPFAQATVTTKQPDFAPQPVTKPGAQIGATKLPTPSFSVFKGLLDNGVAPNAQSQLPKPSFPAAIDLNINSIKPTTTSSIVTIKAMPPVTSTAAAPPPNSFSLNKPSTQTASFTFTPTAKPISSPAIVKVEPVKADKSPFTFNNPPKEAIPKEPEQSVPTASIFANKENVALEKPKPISSLVPDSVNTPQSLSSAMPVSKPLTVFGQAANTASIFGALNANAGAKDKNEKVSMAAESPSIVKALLATPQPSTKSSDAVTKPAFPVSSPSTGFVFSPNPAPKADDKAKPLIAPTPNVATPIATMPMNLVKTTQAPAAAPATPAAVASSTITSPSTTFSFTVSTNTNSSPASIFGPAAQPKPPTTPAVSTATPDPASIFKGFGLSAAVSPSAGGETKPITTPTSSFSFAAAAAAQVASTAATVTPPTTTGASDVNSIFGGFSICKPNVSENANTSAGGGLFTGSAFGSSNAFSTPPSSATSIFGASTATSPAAQAASIFGGGNATPATPSPSSATGIFGANTATPSANIFGTPTGGSNVFSSPQAATPNAGFGGSSPFAAAPTQNTSGSLFGSGFGGGFGAQSPSNTSVFGSPPAFGNSSFGNANVSSGFSGGNQSIAQTGFGTPTSSSSSPFGMNAAAAAQPVFGQTPAFGQAATFGSPKSGFGTFSNPSNAFSSTTTQQNSLFESLGSSENAMTFGNLAQAQTTPPAPKPFAGGSFSSWR